MKKLIATTLASTLVGIVAYAQGTVNFANLGVGLNAPVTLTDGTKAGGSYMAQLLAGATATSLAPVGSPTAFLAAAPGYFNGGVQTIPGVAGGANGFFAIQVWNSTSFSSFATAKAANTANSWGESGYNYTTGILTPFQNVTGGVGSPATPPATLTGLTPFALSPGGGVVPEPSTFALAGLGAAALMFFRRRK